MPNYDFRSLSDYEFELLVKDLLERDIDVPLRSFARGRDRGVDLRCATDINRGLIVQCKHYAESRFAQLKSELIRKELPKITILKPSRYVLATSLALTEGNVRELTELTAPYIRGPQDIYDRGRLNDVLLHQPDIEQKHCKLWLTSTAVLQKILNNHIFVQTEFELAEIQQRIQRFVYTPAFSKVRKELESKHFCIIAGNPGIGKTTLAQMLLLDYMHRGFQPISISGSIQEALRVFNPEVNQVFYYDDFLGRVDIQLSNNEDSRLIKLMSTVSKYKNKRLVLTTREYILADATIISEVLNGARLMDKTYVLKLADYTKFDQALILYNHLSFSRLPNEYMEAVIKDKNYRRIIGHPKYNPRVIENMVDMLALKDVPPGTYVNEFVQNLDDPTRLWEHIYEYQLKPSAQSLLLVLGSMPGNTFLTDLEQAYDVFHSERCRQYNIGCTSGDFRTAIKLLDGNFIRTYKDRSNIVINFANPSVKDLVNRCLVKAVKDFKILAQSTVFFSQALALFSVFQKGHGISKQDEAILLDMLSSKLNELFSVEKDCSLLSHRLNGSSYLDRYSPLEDRFDSSLQLYKGKRIPKNVLASMLTLVKKRIKAKRFNKDSAAKLLSPLTITQLIDDDLILLVKTHLFNNNTDSIEFELALDFQQSYPNLVTAVDCRSLRDQFEEALPDMSFEWIGDEDEIDAELQRLTEIGQLLKVDPSRAFSALEEQREYLVEQQDMDVDDVENDYDNGEGDDAAIDNLFDTLVT